jgi:uncharacterized protein
MLYFDTSFVVPLILPEATSDRVERFLRRRRTEALAISHWSRVEFSSMLARRVRTGELDRKAAREADAQFAAVAAGSFVILLPSVDDFNLSIQFLQRHKTELRAGDALHLAIAANHDVAAIYSLDRTLLKAGKRLGLPTRSGIRLTAREGHSARAAP